MSIRRYLALGLFLCPAACRPEPDEIRDSLLDADRALARDAQARGLDAWLAAIADSSVVLRSNSSVARGVAAARERLAPAYDDSATLNWEPLLAEAARSGDFGYTVGLSQSSRPHPTGGPAMRTGKYVTIWKRARDGTWKIALQVSVVD